jgi:uncharacterized protein YqjF (DUF2071 family)
MTATRTFLTANWRYLAMLNFRIHPAVLQPFVPAGTELDSWHGDALVSIVGFRFLDTRVFGVPIPFHRDFDEINLRFYVRRCVGGQARRGVTFVKEIVPRRAIATVARLAYNEPYLACPTRSVVPAALDVANAGTVGYAWHLEGRWNALQLRSIGPPTVLERGSEAEFITEHFWGYTRQRSGRTIEYEVRHPSWRVWQAADAELECDAARLYGSSFVEALSASPCSAFLAEGSEVVVSRPVTIDQ